MIRSFLFSCAVSGALVAPIFSQAADLKSNLLAYYSFDDCTAGDYTKKQHGLLFNGPLCTTGKVGKALSFDGKDDYVQLPAAVGSIGGNFTAAGWFYLPKTNGNWARFFDFANGEDRDNLVATVGAQGGSFTFMAISPPPSATYGYSYG